MKVLHHLITAAVSSALTLAAVQLFREPGPGPGEPVQGVREPSDAPLPEDRTSARASLQGTPPDGPADERERRFLRDALVQERARAEEARIRPEDDGVDVIRRVLEQRADPTPLLTDFGRFQSHIARNVGPTVRYESTGDLTTILGKEKPKDPCVIVLGPGRFKFDHVLDYWRHQMEEVKSIEIRGAGMDRTTVVSAGALVTVKSRLSSLRLSDLTFEAERDSLLDSRGDVAVVLQNVRVEGAGPERAYAPFYLAGRFYLGCQGCEFRRLDAPARIHGQGIALFERCVFIDVDRGFSAAAGAALGSRVTLRSCEWHDSAVASSGLEYRGAPEYVVEVQGGTVALGRAGLTDEERRKRWGAVWVREAATPTFGPSTTTSTLAAMAQLLEEAPIARGQVAMALRLLVAPRVGPSRYVLTTFDAVKKDNAVFELWLGPSGIELRPFSGGGDGQPPGDDALSLAEALRQCGEPLSSPCDGIYHGREWDGQATVPCIQISWKRTVLTVHPSNARPIKTPWGTSW